MAPILPSIPMIWTLLVYGLTTLVGVALLKLGSVINIEANRHESLATLNDALAKLRDSKASIEH